MTIEDMDSFREFSTEYSDFYDRYNVDVPMEREDQIKGIRLLVRMLSAIFGFPVVIACDCYVKMLDTFDYFEEEKETIMAELAASLTNHLDEEIGDPLVYNEMEDLMDEIINDTLKLTDQQSIPGAGSAKIDERLESFKNQLEQAWQKDLGSGPS